MKQRYYYIYIITNTLTYKSYVGSKILDNKKNYWGSSKYLKADIKEYGLWNFSKGIIGVYQFITKKELLDRETQAIKDFNTLNPNGYNKYEPNKNYGFCMIGTQQSGEKNGMFGKHLSGEKSGMFGKHHSEQTKQNMRKPHRPFSEESKQNMRKPHGPISEENRQNMRKPKSEEHKQNMRKPHRPVSEEAKQNMKLGASVGWIKRRRKI